MEGGSSSRGKSVSADDATSFLNEAKDVLSMHNQRDKYCVLLLLLKYFLLRKITFLDLKAQVGMLLKEHPRLIEGFNAFLPRGHEITLNRIINATPTPKMLFEKIYSFVDNVKNRFKGTENDQIFTSLIKILTTNQSAALTEIYPEVALLLIDHTDLLNDFEILLGCDGAPQ